jgi:hypothetical protein
LLYLIVPFRKTRLGVKTYIYSNVNSTDFISVLVAILEQPSPYFSVATMEAEDMKHKKEN